MPATSDSREEHSNRRPHVQGPLNWWLYWPSNKLKPFGMVKGINKKRPTRSMSQPKANERADSPMLSGSFLHLLAAANHILKAEKTRLSRRQYTRIAEQVAVQAIMDLSDSASLSGDSSSEDDFGSELVTEVPVDAPRHSVKRARRRVKNSKYADYDCSME